LPGITELNNMGDELVMLATAKEGAENVKKALVGDAAALNALGYDAGEAVNKAELRALLLQYETRVTALTQQQQQSGAGTSNGTCASRSRNIPYTHAAYICRPCSFSAPRH
jgi:hypothetical protein